MRLLLLRAIAMLLTMSCSAGEPPRSVPPGTRHAFIPLRDFATNVSSGDGSFFDPYYGVPDTGGGLTVAFEGGTPYWETRPELRLVRVADGAEIPGETNDGWRDLHGGEIPNATGTVALSFVPSEPLAPGWHVLSVDLSPVAIGTAGDGPIVYLSRAVGDVLVARLRSDSSVHWVTTTARRTSDSVEFSCALSEFLSGVALARWSTATTVTVRYDGAPVECSLAFGEGGLAARCPRTEPGVRVRIDVDSAVVTLPDGTTPMVHSFGAPSSDTPIHVDPDLGLAAAGIMP